MSTIFTSGGITPFLAKAVTFPGHLAAVVAKSLWKFITHSSDIRFLTKEKEALPFRSENTYNGNKGDTE